MEEKTDGRSKPITKKEFFAAWDEEPTKTAVAKRLGISRPTLDLRAAEFGAVWTRRVTATDKQLVALARKHGRDYEAIAEQTGYSVKTVQNKVNQLIRDGKLKLTGKLKPLDPSKEKKKQARLFCRLRKRGLSLEDMAAETGYKNAASVAARISKLKAEGFDIPTRSEAVG